MTVTALFLALAPCFCLQTPLKRHLKGLQMSHQTHAFLEFPPLFREALRSPCEAPAKPTRSLRGPISYHHPLACACEAQTSSSIIPSAETRYLALARQEPLRNHLGKATVFHKAVRSQPLHKSIPCVAISEGLPSVYRPVATKNTAHLDKAQLTHIPIRAY